MTTVKTKKKPAPKTVTKAKSTKVSKAKVAKPVRRTAFPELQIASIYEVLATQKALDSLVYDLRGAGYVSQGVIIASGTSSRHVAGIVDRIEEAMLKLEEKPLSISGTAGSEWILMDYGDLLIHVFYEPTRQFYNLEDLFHEYPKVSPPEHLVQPLSKLQTGILIKRA